MQNSCKKKNKLLHFFLQKQRDKLLLYLWYDIQWEK